jgi:hypothetical protein
VDPRRSLPLTFHYNADRAQRSFLRSHHSWSSYEEKDDLIDKHIIFDKLLTDETARKEYRAFVQQMQRNRESMRGEMERRTIYGGSEFIQRLNKRYKIEAVIKKRGRPRKESSEKLIKWNRPLLNFFRFARP